jgi:uncharacterized protein YbjQ (UPF0145 family)
MGIAKATQEAAKRDALANKRLTLNSRGSAVLFLNLAPHISHHIPHFYRRECMQLTTTPSIEGKRITRYCGVIAGEAILGANLFKDLFAGIRDLVGGRSGTYERELQRAREIALEELTQRAADVGANAVVGIDIDYEIMGKENGMLMVSASGTAVVVE